MTGIVDSLGQWLASRQRSTRLLDHVGRWIGRTLAIAVVAAAGLTAAHALFELVGPVLTQLMSLVERVAVIAEHVLSLIACGVVSLILIAWWRRRR